ncbi:MAG: helix-turn-helix domain-containing protein [Streptococcus sp.]|nr:helix-turn-helix domain-containing protein [Streptococcus sp.]
MLLRICNALNCDVGDIMEFVREENFEEQERKDAFPNG